MGMGDVRRWWCLAWLRPGMDRLHSRARCFLHLNWLLFIVAWGCTHLLCNNDACCVDNKKTEHP